MTFLIKYSINTEKYPFSERDKGDRFERLMQAIPANRSKISPYIKKSLAME